MHEAEMREAVGRLLASVQAHAQDMDGAENPDYRMLAFVRIGQACEEFLDAARPIVNDYLREAPARLAGLRV